MSKPIPMAVLALLVTASNALAAPDPPGAQARLEAELARLSAGVGGEVGVAAVKLESGARISMNAGDRFPMASTFKVAVAATVLSQVDQGRLRLDQLVPIRPDQVVESEGVAELFPHAGVALSVENLLETMLTRSDNTAADVLVDLAGGPGAVTAWLHGRGVRDQRVDRDTAGLIRSYFDLPPGPVMEVIREAAKTNPGVVAVEDQPKAAFDDDPRDTSTPDAMVRLLSRIYRGEALSPASTELITQIMQRCITGRQRLRGLLPPGVVVIDKTGTIGGTVNDVGVITLPDGLGHVAIAVFIKASAVPVVQRERLIADLGRAIYDYMLIQAP